MSKLIYHSSPRESSRFSVKTSPFHLSAETVVVLLSSLLLLLTRTSFASQIFPDPEPDVEKSLDQQKSPSSSSTSSAHLPVPVQAERRDVTRDLFNKDDGAVDSSLLSPSTKTLFFGEDTNGVPIVIGTWFRYGSYTLAFAMFGTAFLIACSAAAVYYTLFVVTEPSQQVRSAKSPLQNGLDGWSVGRVLRAVQVAYETFETFDPYSPSCQLKAVCETQESSYFQGSVLKRLVHFLVHTEYVRRKFYNADELQAADRVGNDPSETCKDKYSECKFSLSKVYEYYKNI